jgi:CRP-like cAMP-binding protein
MSTSGLGKVYSNGEVIVRQGERGDCMYAVQQGRLEVLRESENGEVRIAVLEEGDIFGEMAIFEREARSATIRVLDEARVLTVDKKTFLRRVQEDPSLAFNLVRMMSGRIRKLTGEIASLAKAQAAGPNTDSRNRRLGNDRRSGRDRRSRVERRSGKDRRKPGAR